MMKYETIIWDWNGTLLDDVALALDIVNDILRDHDLDSLTPERYQDIFDFPVQLYYERAGMNFVEISFETISNRYCREFEEKIESTRLFSDAQAALAVIAESGVRQFVLSSTEHEALVRMVTNLGVAQAFHAIQGMPDGFARGKTGVGRVLLQSHKINPRSSVMIGDTRHDWEVAESLGMDCLLVSTGHQSSVRLSSVGCPVLDSASEVVNYLKDRH